MTEPLLATLAVPAALLLDRWLGEPRRAHPLVAFGRVAAALEARLNGCAGSNVGRGVLAVLLLVVPPVAAAMALTVLLPAWAWFPIATLMLYLAIGGRSLAEHGRAVSGPLRCGDTDTARTAVRALVSRDAARLDEAGIATAATESMLENGADAVFASLFWFVIGGLPALVAHRAVNTLDAMWGYRGTRYNAFGRCAAQLDDVLGWAPARLTALSYALCGRTGAALRCWRQQAQDWDSPNAGPVMAAGAGALEVVLGGPAPYAEGIRQRPPLGTGITASAAHIDAAIALVHRCVGLWAGVIVTTGGLAWAWRTAAA
ncbi:adenosylcobinamide-phosphate synthase CbiB [Algiphilus sp.]|uniref:adenosylcobinamide-phosphate synthase CbiB n=1 Tax=Algiphilus sp. TaxID=1872431 RepID=UPI0025C17172|nr:adenosylcobinamide-phosphate synthase CbiB [Algiphilus sp.]MCK5771830.1 cobalamin biosynthesis protein [Algiphilus sp.]